MELGKNISYKIIQGLAMRYTTLLISIAMLVACNLEKPSFGAAGNFQLAEPLLTVDSLLFKNTSQISMTLGFPNSEIRYTTNGTAVEASSELYTGPLTLDRSATIKAKAFHSDFKSSEEATIQVTQIANNISNAIIDLSVPPHENYKGLGAVGLTDMQKGSLQFRSGNQWLGFQESSVTINLTLATKMRLSILKVSSLQNQGGWIFAPKKITVFSELKQIGELLLDNAADKQENQLKIITVPLTEGDYAQLKIVVTSLEKIPEWHPGKGTLPWLFLDEILVE